jgi:hypothetical protein
MASADPAASAAVRCVQQEFVVSGLANCCHTPRLATGSVIASGQPYKTRMMIRRPITAQCGVLSGLHGGHWLT